MQTSVPVDNEFDDSISRSPRAQGVKRDHAEENPQAPNKAARLETITKRDGPSSDSPSQSATPSGTSRPKQVQSSARAIHEQRLPPIKNFLATAPAPVRSPAHLNGSLPDFATQMNGQPLGPLRFDDTNQVPSDSSLQNTSAAQPLPANFDHNISRMDVPVQNPRMAQVPTYSQASANGNAVFHALHDDQIGPCRQAPFHTAQLPSRPPPPHPCLHDVNLLSSIAQSLASLSKEKVLEILATAAMQRCITPISMRPSRKNLLKRLLVNMPRSLRCSNISLLSPEMNKELLLIGITQLPQPMQHRPSRTNSVNNTNSTNKISNQESSRTSTTKLKRR